MPLLAPLRVHQTTATAGTGPMQLDPVRAAYRAFRVAYGNGELCPFVRTNNSGAYEIGFATLTIGVTDTLTPTDLIASSNGGAPVNWTTASCDVFAWEGAASLYSATASGNFTLDETNWSNVVAYTGSGGNTCTLVELDTLPLGWTSTIVHCGSGTLNIALSGSDVFLGASVASIDPGNCVQFVHNPAGWIAVVISAASLGTLTGVNGTAGQISSVTAGSVVTLSLANAGTAGTYGDADEVPQFTTDTKGRVTSVTSIPITIPSGSVTGLGTAAVQNIGTSGANVPLLSTGNTWGATQAFGALSASGQFTSTVTTGTAPFVVASTTQVANLNAATLDGATFAAPGAIGGGTPGSGAFTTLSSTSTITASGNIFVAKTATAAAFFLSADTGQQRQIVARTGTSLRWIMNIANNVAESGTNAGSNFELFNYDDSGNSLGASVQITRATGGIILGAQGGSSGSLGVIPIASSNRRVTVSGSNGGNPEIGATGGNIAFTAGVTFTVSPVLCIPASGGASFVQDTATVQNRLYIGRTAGLNRIAFGTSNDSETGTNAGSNFIMSMYDDTGVFLRNVLQVIRASGQTSLGGTLGVEAFRAVPVASQNRCVIATGSNGGNPTLSVSAGALGITSPVVMSGTPGTVGTLQLTGTAPQQWFLENDQVAPAGLTRFLMDGNALRVQRNTSASNDFATSTGVLVLADPNNRVIVGTATSGQTNGSVAGFLQVLGTDTNTSSMNLAKYANSTVQPIIMLSSSRNATIGSQTIVQSGDPLGRITWAGSDGVAGIPAGYIQAVVDGTPGVNDMPTRLEFAVTPDGAATSSLAMSILQDQTIKLEAPSFAANGTVAVTLTSLGPTGANTTVQEWLVIRNAAGTARYIPCY